MSHRGGKPFARCALGRSAVGCQVALLLLGLGLSARQGEAQEGALRYRRIFVQEEKLDEHVRGLLPLKREEFERRVKELGASPDSGHLAAQVRIDEAEYRGRIVDDQIVGGTGDLEIHSTADGVAALRMAPFNLALTGAVWRGETDQPAVLGLAAGGGLTCLVERNAKLQVAWSLRGRREDQGAVAFAFQLPAAPICRLRLEAPTDLILTAEPGIAKLEPAAAGVKGERIWTVELGGSSEVVVRVSQRQAAAVSPAVVLVREDIQYSVHPATLDVEASLALDVLQQSLQQLTLSLDESIQPTALRLGPNQLTWTLLPVTNGQRLLLVELPEPLAGAGHSLQLSGVASWSGERGWRLPRVRLIDGIWQDGRATLTAPAALRLGATAIGGCRQTGFSASSPARTNDQFQFQLYLADAGIEIGPSVAPAAFIEASGTHLQFDTTQIVGTCIAELAVAAGERFEIEAIVPQRWVVDTVEVQPADYLEDRSVTPRGPGLQTLRLLLRRPLAEGHPLRVVVKAHSRRPPAGQGPLDGNQLRVIEFLDVRESRRLVSLQNLDPRVHLQTTSDEGLVRLDPQTLAADQVRLFEAQAGPVLFERSSASEAVGVLLEPTSPQFQAEVVVQAFVEPTQLRQRIRLRCQPEASSIGQVQVRLSPVPGSIDWRLVGEEGRGLVARKLASDAATADEAVYELSLPQPRSAPFELTGEFTTPFGSGRAVVLASLPAARAQTGLVEVYATDGRQLTISSEEVRPLPPSDLGQATFGTLRGLYAYEPGRRAAVRVAPHAADAGPALAWIESLAVASRFATDSSGEHEAAFQVTNAGRTAFDFELPPSAIEVRATLDGSSSFAEIQRPAAGNYAVALPAGQRHVLVRIRYSTDPMGRSWLPWGQFSAPIPQTTLPVLASHWRIDLPPDLSAGWSELPAGEVAGLGEQADVKSPAAGWSRYEVPLPVGKMATIGIFQPAMLRAWAWCLGLAAAALAYRLLVGRMALTVLLAGVAAALALWVSPVLAPLALGIAIGIAAGGAGLALRPRPAALETMTLSSHGSTVAVVGPAAGVAVLIAVLWAANRAAAAPPEKPADDAPAALRVVMPVDDREQPAGDYVFLDPKLYDALVKPAGRTAAAPENWLVSGAQYRLVGPPRGEGARRSVDELVVQFDLETFQAGVLVPLAFQRAQVHLVEGRAMLDGQPVRLDWSPDGRQLQFTVDTSGRHRLELVLGAVAEANDAGAVLDLEIPPVAVARLLSPAADEQVQVESSLGSRTLGIADAETVWQLGPTRRLTVRWPASAGSVNLAPRVEAEQLLLWTIRPGSVVADARFRIRPIGGQVGEVVVRIDPRLRLLPLDPAQPVIRHSLEAGLPANTLRLVLREPATTEATVELSLLWTGSAGIGNLVLPTVAVAADEVTRTWTGVSLAPGLDWETAPAARPGDPALADFTTAWGEAPDERTAFFDLKNPAISQLAVRPAQTQIRSDQSLDCSFSGNSAVVQFRADLSDVPPDAFQHRLTMTPRLHARKVTVWDAAASVPVRWNQEPDGSLFVSLSQPPPSTLRLEVVAEQPLAEGAARAAVPLVRYVGAGQTTFAVRFFRQPDVLVAVQSVPAAWKPVAVASPGEFRAGLGRLVATLDQAATGQNPPSPQVTLAVNQPQISGSLVIRVERAATGWVAVADCLLDVQGGQLDLVRIQTPLNWVGPFEINPAVEQRLELAPGEIGRQLVIRPQRAMAGAVRLSIRGPLKSSGGELVAAPELKLIDAPLVQRIVALPRRLAAQRLEWETSGLQTADPAGLALPAEVILAGHEVFQAVADRFAAIARLRDRPTSSPVVRLADHDLQLGPEGEFVGRSRFALDPGGARQMTLELPAGQQLVDVAVEGMPAQLSRIGGRRWQLGLVAERLPQQIEIVSRGRVATERDATGKLILAAPRLVEARIQRTLWTVRGAGTGGGEGSVSPSHQQGARLASIADVLSGLADMPAADVPASAVASCWANWERRFGQERAALPKTDSILPIDLAKRVRETESEVAAVRNQLLSMGVVPADSPPLVVSKALERSSSANRDNPTCYEFKGPAETLAVVLPALQSTSDGRLLWAGLCLVAAIGLSRLVASRQVRQWLAEHAPLVLALAGIGWVWLGPLGWIGWFAVGLAVWLALRSPWPKRTDEPLSSVVRRSSLLR